MDGNGMFRVIKWMQQWLGEQVEDVPPSLAVCEFDCHKDRCSLRQWLICEERLEGPGSLRENHGAARSNPWPAKKKAAVVLEVLKNERTPAELCEFHGITDSHLQEWTAEFLGPGGQSHATERPTNPSETDGGDLVPLIALMKKKVAGRMVPPAGGDVRDYPASPFGGRR